MNYKKIVLDAIKKLYNQKLVAGTSGNISIRNLSKNDSFFITPSGKSYDEMLEDDIVEVNSLGKSYVDGQIPSSEWKMHLEIYKRYPNINAVIHTHSPYATAFAVNREEIPLISIEMKPFLGGSIKVSPYEKPGSTELAESIIPYLKDRSACLLANHGVISCGKSMEDAFLSSEYVEDVAKIYYIAKTCGSPIILE